MSPSSLVTFEALLRGFTGRPPFGVAPPRDYRLFVAPRGEHPVRVAAVPIRDGGVTTFYIGIDPAGPYYSLLGGIPRGWSKPELDILLPDSTGGGYPIRLHFGTQSAKTTAVAAGLTRDGQSSASAQSFDAFEGVTHDRTGLSAVSLGHERERLALEPVEGGFGLSLRGPPNTLRPHFHGTREGRSGEGPIHIVIAEPLFRGSEFVPLSALAAESTLEAKKLAGIPAFWVIWNVGETLVFLGGNGKMRQLPRTGYHLRYNPDNQKIEVVIRVEMGEVVMTPPDDDDGPFFGSVSFRPMPAGGPIWDFTPREVPVQRDDHLKYLDNPGIWLGEEDPMLRRTTRKDRRSFPYAFLGADQIRDYLGLVRGYGRPLPPGLRVGLSMMDGLRTTFEGGQRDLWWQDLVGMAVTDGGLYLSQANPSSEKPVFFRLTGSSSEETSGAVFGAVDPAHHLVPVLLSPDR